jgi:hypothetical protein
MKAGFGAGSGISNQRAGIGNQAAKKEITE